jgi:hypothetical protein
MKTKLSFLFIIILFYTACTSTKHSSDPNVWVNKEKIQGKSFDKVFIIVMTADVEARSVFENDLAAMATSRGHKVVKSSDVIPISLQNPKLPTKDEVISKIKETGCDGAFVASLLKKEESIDYTQGTTAYSVSPYSAYSGTFTGYYSYWYPSVSTPDYYDHEKTYFMRSNLYDVATEEIMWSVQSKIFSPSTLKQFSKEYTATLVKQLEKQKLLKTKTN